METLTFISNPKDKSVHQVDVIEKYGDTEVVFTKDSKCFPINEVETISGIDYFAKKLKIIKSVKELTEDEMDEFIDSKSLKKNKSFKIFGWTITLSKSK
jgi:hypothetical protein